MIKINLLNKKPFSQGFTLAEVLITLAVIGVVATMVIPGLLNDARDQELKAKFKKDYAILEQAIKLMMFDRGGNLLDISNEVSGTTENSIGNLMEKYLPIGPVICPSGSNDCSYEIKFSSGYSQNHQTRFILNDGAVIILIEFMLNGDPSYGDGYTNLQNMNRPVDDISVNPRNGAGVGNWILLDVNGYRKPNVVGKDVFIMPLTSSGIRLYEGDYDCKIFKNGINDHFGCPREALMNVN